MAKRKIFDLGAAGYPRYQGIDIEAVDWGAPLTEELLEEMRQLVRRAFDAQLQAQYRAAFFGNFSIQGCPIVEEDEPMPPNVWRVQSSKRVSAEDDPAVPPGKVAFTRGPGTFNARLRLKALGGRWDPDVLGGAWLVPEEHADAAEANVRLGAKAGQELPAEDAATPEQPTEKITCYVCGEKRPAWEFARLKGAVLTDWYCGCETRKLGATPRTATTRGAR